MTRVEKTDQLEADRRLDALTDRQSELGGTDEPMIAHQLVLSVAADSIASGAQPSVKAPRTKNPSPTPALPLRSVDLVPWRI